MSFSLDSSHTHTPHSLEKIYNFIFRDYTRARSILVSQVYTYTSLSWTGQWVLLVDILWWTVSTESEFIYDKVWPEFYISSFIFTLNIACWFPIGHKPILCVYNRILPQTAIIIKSYRCVKILGGYKKSENIELQKANITLVAFASQSRNKSQSADAVHTKIIMNSMNINLQCRF